MRLQSLWVGGDGEGKLKTITDLILFGLESGAEGHAPWGVDHSRVQDFLKHSGQDPTGAIWDAIVLHELAKKAMGGVSTAGVVRREWPQSLEDGGIAFSGGFSLDGKKSLVEQVQENKKKVFKIVEPIIKNPEKESGYNKIHRVTGGRY